MTMPTLTLYYADGANCSERIRWLLAWKQLPCQQINIEQADTPPDLQAHFAAISPFGQVPVLEVDGAALTESMAIAEYLEEIAPACPLLGANPWQRARIRQVCEIVNAGLHPVQNSSAVRYYRPDLSKAGMRPLRAGWLARHLQQIQPLLWQHSNHAVGEAFSLADIFLALIWRKALALGLPPQQLPAFVHYWEFLQQQPAVRASCQGLALAGQDE